MQTRRGMEQQPAQREPEANMQRESFGELLSQLANNSAALVRDEIALAKEEMSEKVGSLQSGVTVTAVGAIVALVGVLSLVAALILGLAEFMEPWVSALIVGLVFAIAGGVTALSGIGKIKRTNLKPEQTIETLEEDKEWLKELT